MNTQLQGRNMIQECRNQGVIATRKHTLQWVMGPETNLIEFGDILGLIGWKSINLVA